MELDTSVLPEFVLIAPAPRYNPRTQKTGPSLCDAWIAALEALPEPVSSRFKVKEAMLDPVALKEEFGTFECLVSPANAFGIMDGGYDLALSRAFAKERADIWDLTNVVQDVLKRRHRGYLPPASCTLVPLPAHLTATNPLGCKAIAVVPTMRTPEDVSWHVDLVYESMWNLLSALLHWNEGERPEGEEPIKRVLMTGLGTGNGGIGFDKCARQMALATLNFALGWGERPRWDDLLTRATEVDETRTL